MADLFPPDQYSTVYGLGFNPPTYSAPPDADPGAAASDPLQANALYTGGGQEAPPPVSPAPSQGGGSGFLSSILPSWLGGTSGEPVAGSVLPRATGGIGGLGSNAMMGLGLGLLGGNRLDPYGRAIAGYQAGARTDLEARKAEAEAQYRQSDIGLRKQQLQQARDIAYKPAIHFQTQEDPNTGYTTTRAFLFNPSTSAVQEIPLGAADKMADGGKVGISITNPIDGSTIPCPPGMNCKQVRNQLATTYAKVQSGEMTGPQARATSGAAIMDQATKPFGDLAPDKVKSTDLDVQGTSKLGRGLEAAGKSTGSIGTAVTGGLQKGPYRDFRTGKDAWITGLMMARGISPAAENVRQEFDRTFWPQMDETDNDAAILAKRALRAQAEKEIKASAGAFYRAGRDNTGEQPRTTKQLGGQTYYQNNAGKWFDTWPPK